MSEKIKSENDFVEWATWLIKKNYPVPTKDIYKMAKILELRYYKNKEKNANVQSIPDGGEEPPSTSS